MGCLMRKNYLSNYLLINKFNMNFLIIPILVFFIKLFSWDFFICYCILCIFSYKKNYYQNIIKVVQLVFF